MRVFDDRWRQRCRAAGRTATQSSATRSFHDMPTEIGTGAGSRWYEINFFDHVLPDVRDVEIAGLPVEGDAPRIAQTVRPHLGSSGNAVRKRVVRGDRVRSAEVDVEAQQFPQPFERVLRAIVRIVGRAAVTGRN